jgi:hypothetical protein
LQGHHQEKRQDRRQRFRGEFLLRIPPAPDRRAPLGVQEPGVLRVRARNISSNGIAFLHTGRIFAEEVMICLNGNAAEPRWYLGNIVRRRQVQNEFWEYGVQLTGRCEAEPQ